MTMPFVKTLIRTAVITGLAGGAAVIVAGPDRVGALVSQARGNINGVIDRAIDDPVALRAQIRSLEQQYPEKIAEVRADLAELKQQTTQLTQERQLSERVVALADRDLGQMHGLLARAEEAQTDGAVVRVVFNNEPVELDDAYAKASRMQQVKEAHAARLADIDRDAGYLKEQESRLSDLLTQLETEQASFQSQLWQLDRQIDAIARNERMIEMVEKRNETIDRHSRYRSDSLEQLNAKFSQIRSKQEARLQSITSNRSMTNYEDRARIELDARNFTGGSNLGKPTNSVEIKPPVLDIRPDSIGPNPHADDVKADDAKSPKSSGGVASIVR
jgi:chromosome segregation ATPase